jgi:hypothetical protein
MLKMDGIRQKSWCRPSSFSECIGVFGVFLRQLFAKRHQKHGAYSLKYKKLWDSFGGLGNSPYLCAANVNGD